MGLSMLPVKITLDPTPIEKLQEAIRQLKAIDSIIDAKACQKNKLHIAYDGSSTIAL